MLIRTHYVKDLLANRGKDVVIAGWVENVKELPNLRFVIIRDRTGVAQITVHKKDSPQELVSLSEKLNIQDVIAVEASVPEKQIAKIGPEVKPKSITVLNKSESPLPIDITGASETMLDTRLDWRVLDPEKSQKPRNNEGRSQVHGRLGGISTHERFHPSFNSCNSRRTERRRFGGIQDRLFREQRISQAGPAACTGSLQSRVAWIGFMTWAPTGGQKPPTRRDTFANTERVRWNLVSSMTSWTPNACRRK